MMIPEFKNKGLLHILINLFILAVFVLIFKYFSDNVISKEGFVQQEKFLLKKDGNSYDEFYAQVYDKIHSPDPKKELAEILKITGADKNSAFLDVGSGTGCTCWLDRLRAKCIGIDNRRQWLLWQKRSVDPW